jgi:hypothetical protein
VLSLRGSVSANPRTAVRRRVIYKMTRGLLAHLFDKMTRPAPRREIKFRCQPADLPQLCERVPIYAPAP